MASNVENLAQAFAGWGKDNPANMRDVLHPECELVVPESIPYGGTFLCFSDYARPAMARTR